MDTCSIFLSTLTLLIPVLVVVLTLELFLSFNLLILVVIEDDLYFSDNSTKLQSSIESKRAFIIISLLGLGLLLLLKYSFNSDIISCGLTYTGFTLLSGYFTKGIQSKYSV